MPTVVAMPPGAQLDVPVSPPGTPSGERPVVLHVRCISGKGGGPEKTILNSPRFLTKLGYDAYCAYLHDDEFDHLQQRAKQCHAPLLSFPERGRFDWRVLQRLIRTCQSRRVAIWHGHEYKSNLFGLIARRFLPSMKLVTTVHGWIDSTRRLRAYNKLDRWCIPYYDEVLCVSEELHARCLQIGTPAARCHLVVNGIDLLEHQRTLSREEARSYVAGPTSGLLLGAAGRLSKEKGFNHLIRAVRRLVDQGTAVTLWIAGEGPERLELEQLTRDLNCEQHVFFLGHVERMRDFFQSLDVYVLSSLHEGLPNVLLEAMAFEVPIVATRIAATANLLDGECAVLVEPGSDQELAAGLRRALDDNEWRRLSGVAGRRVVEESFSFWRRMEKVAAIYDSLLSRRYQQGQRH